MIIVDRDLRRLIQDRQLFIQSIDPERPFDSSTQIGPGSIDLRLSNNIRKYKRKVNIIDLALAGDTEPVEIPPNGEIIIQPNEIILATTMEIVILPSNIAGLITGRSSIARLGLLVHVSQEYMQPGHSQLVPLQLVNVIDRPIRIQPFLPICQVALFYTSSRAEVPYGSKKDAKYSSELLEPQPSKIGVELGLEKAEQVSVSKNPHKFQEIQEEVTKLRKETNEGASLDELKTKLSGILAMIYIVLGASISVLIQEFDVKPFPSLKLIISSAFMLFCIVIIVLANWRK